MGTDDKHAHRHTPGMPPGGLRQLSQRYADGLLSETDYRRARRSLIEQVVAGLVSASDLNEVGRDESPLEAPRPLPMTILRSYCRRWLHRQLAAGLLLALLATAALFLVLRS